MLPAFIMSPRLVRSLEGISLWLAMLMLLFIPPLYAEAAMAQHNEGAGAFLLCFLKQRLAGQNLGGTCNGIINQRSRYRKMPASTA